MDAMVGACRGMLCIYISFCNTTAQAIGRESAVGTLVVRSVSPGSTRNILVSGVLYMEASVLCPLSPVPECAQVQQLGKRLNECMTY